MTTPVFTLRARLSIGVLVRSAGSRAAPPTLRRLRHAVAALFVLDGAVFGSWAARVPDVAAHVGTGHTGLGAALLCLSLGALACMQVTGVLCARLGAGLISAVAAVVVCLAAGLPGLAGSVPALCAGLFVFGAATGMVNVAANSLGVKVEARVGRPLLSGLHAGFSLGGLGGALAGGLASSLMGVAPHLLLVAGAGLLVTAWAVPTLVGADGDPDAPPSVEVRPTRRPTPALVVLGAVAGCTAYGEGALTDWGALHLREGLHAEPVLAAAGYAGFSLAMAAGRLAGSRLVHTVGEQRLLVGGALLAAVGVLAATTTADLEVALGGFVLVGLGLANVFPLAIARAGALGGASGIALATTVGYTGLLGGPPVIGFLAEQAGLAAALGTVAVLAVSAAVLVTTLDGDAVRLPTLPSLPALPGLPGLPGLPPAAARIAARGASGVRPVLAGCLRGTGVYVRDLTALAPSG